MGHEHGPFEAARDREKWRYLNAFETPKRFQRWRQEALAATASGEQGAKAFIDRSSERPIGSTSGSFGVERAIPGSDETRTAKIGVVSLREPNAGGSDG